MAFLLVCAFVLCLEHVGQLVHYPGLVGLLVQRDGWAPSAQRQVGKGRAIARHDSNSKLELITNACLQ